MANWHAYLCVPEVFWVEVAPSIKPPNGSLIWCIDGMRVVHIRYGYGLVSKALKQAMIPHALSTFMGEEHQPRQRIQFYCDREGETYEGATEWDLCQQNQYYYGFCEHGQRLSNTQCYQMAFAMMGHNFNVEDDLKHFTAMARLRQALTN